MSATLSDPAIQVEDTPAGAVLVKLLTEITSELRKAPYDLPKEGPVSVRQVGRWLSCSDRTVYRLVGNGVLPKIHRIGENLARLDASDCWEHYAQHLHEQKNPSKAA